MAEETTGGCYQYLQPGGKSGGTKHRSQRYKASNMAFEEMVKMVSILKMADYDSKHGLYKTPNLRKAKIMEK